MERYRRTLIASCNEDLQVEHPVCGGQSPAFHFHTTLPCIVGSTLRGHQVVEVCEACQKCLLAAVGMVKPLHRKEFPLDGVMGLIQQGTDDGHLWIFEDRIS